MSTTRSWMTWGVSAVVFLALPGCQWFASGPWPAPVLPVDGALPACANQADHDVLARATEKDAQGHARSVWVHAVEPSPFRWRYRHLEELIEQPPRQRPNFRRALADADPAIAGNAAIAAARLGDAHAVASLVRAIRTPTLPMPMRCAAVEALATLASDEATDGLRQLLATYGVGGNAPELHAELLRGLAPRATPDDDRYFDAGLRAASVEVKLAAMSRWQSGGELPKEVIELRHQSDPRLRSAVLDAMQRARHPEALERAADALNDSDLDVRLVAIRCLGEIGTEDAQAKLRPMREKTHSERIRAMAVVALAQCGARRDVLAAIDDESWRVRLCVAESLEAWPQADAARVAKALLDDTSPHVQRRVVASLAAWPVDLAGPLLLSAMNSRSFNLRREAAATLAKLWAQAGEFPFDADAERRNTEIERLLVRFKADYPAAVVAASAVTTDTVQASADERRRLETLIEQLGSLEVIQRRRAAGELARWGEKRPWPPGMIERIYARSAAESDNLVWQDLLTAVALGGPPAHQFAYAGLSHSSAEVRRRACELLAGDPSPRHARVLLPTLEDSNPAVVSAALVALAAAGKLEDPEPVRALLGSSNPQICLDAAVALGRSGDRAGMAALERLAYHSDPNIQRQAAEAMGDLAEASFVPALIHLLEGHVSVQRAALGALPRCLGRDIGAEGPPGENTSQRIARWRAWAQAQGPQ